MTIELSEGGFFDREIPKRDDWRNQFKHVYEGRMGG